MKKPLTKLQMEVLKNFFARPIGKSYFLTGGTALSGFYFYHRESIDLDLFTFETIENIGSNKITAIFSRTEAKDFIDLYFILRKKLFTFQKLLQDAKKKDLGLSEFYLAHMLLEVKKIKNFPKMLTPFNKKSMENYFVLLANKLLLEAKPKEV